MKTDTYIRCKQILMIHKSVLVSKGRSRKSLTIKCSTVF